MRVFKEQSPEALRETLRGNLAYELCARLAPKLPFLRMDGGWMDTGFETASQQEDTHG